MRRTALLALLAMLLTALPAAAGSGHAFAATCTSSISGPNDPSFAPSERNSASGGTYNAEEWYLYDCIPQSAPLATDPTGAAGMSVIKAWDAYGSRGNDGVVVAYLEGGVNWRKDDSRDLRTRAYLNTGELPLPEHADGSTCAAYDCDGNGVVNVDDYKDDPRVKHPFLHADTAGGITSEDLIVAFSNGRDDDHNGYVDDISGWNTFRETNDPQTDQSVYDHANSQSELAVATADDGFGRAGICPKCRLLSVKTGDEAIDRSDRDAAGILYATDAGASVIVAVSITLGDGPALQSAVDYAYRHGVTVVFASNDFESTDHTEGMRLAHVWPGNGVVADLTNRQGQSLPVDRTTSTFRSRSSLTSYGAHSLFVAASRDGSTSESTPANGGVAAMVYSAGLDTHQKPPLDADEVKQVVRSTTSDVDATPPSTVGSPFPALPGWDVQYGYGRPDVYAAVKAVHDGMIPPHASIESPEWYTAADPTRQKTLHVTADVGARRASAYRWQLQFAPGVQPTDAQFATVASGAGGGGAAGLQTVSGDVDLSAVPASFWGGDYALTADRLSAERYTATVRLRVTDDRGLVGEDRRAVQVRHDASELPGFPLRIGEAGDSSPTLADVEGRGALDVIVASEGTVHALRPDGTEAPGWPVHTGPAPEWDPREPTNHLASAGFRQATPSEDPISTALTVGDLRHDGEVDVVASTVNGRVWAWDGTGHVLPGFPVQTDRAFASQTVPSPDTPYVRNRSAGAFSSPVLVDLDGDGRLEIVLPAFDGRIYAWRADGTPQPGWPVETQNPSTTQPPGFTYARDYKVATTQAIADVDGDGVPDVVVALQDTSFPTASAATGVRGYLTAFHGQGNLTPGGALISGYPVMIPAAAQGYGTAQDFITEGVQTPVVMNLATGPVAVANAGLFSEMKVDLRRATVTAMGTSSFAADGPLQQATALVHFTSSASAGYLLPGSVTPQVAQGGSATSDVATGIVATPGLGIKIRNGVAAYDVTSGAVLPGFATPARQQGLPILAAPALADVSGDGRPDVVLGGDSAALVAYDAVTGAAVPGFPKWTGGFSLWTPAVGDLLGDGSTVVVEQTREGYVHAWHTAGRLGTENAWHWHQDDRATGQLGVDTRPPAAVRDLSLSGSTLSWTGTGGDWTVGKAARYDVFHVAVGPLAATALASAEKVGGVPAAMAAGGRMSMSVPTGTGTYGVRAVDAAGNLGQLRTVAAVAAPAGGSGVVAASPVPSAATGIAAPGSLAVSRSEGASSSPARRGVTAGAPVGGDVGPAMPVASHRGTLARTGADTWPPALASGLLLLALLAQRRRRVNRPGRQLPVLR